MTTIILTVEQVAAAMLMAATNDVRYYLNGIYLDAVNKRMVATDGHAIYIAKNVTTFEHSVILPRFKIPTGTKSIDITHEGANVYEVIFVCGKGTNTRIVREQVTAIDRTYPSYWIALQDLPEVGINNIGIDLWLLAKAAKVFKYAKLSFTKDDGIVYVTSDATPDELIGIMPARAKHVFTNTELKTFTSVRN